MDNKPSLENDIEITVAGFLYELWNQKIKLVIVFSFFAFLSLLYQFLTNNKFELTYEIPIETNIYQGDLNTNNFVGFVGINRFLLQNDFKFQLNEQFVNSKLVNNFNDKALLANTLIQYIEKNYELNNDKLDDHEKKVLLDELTSNFKIIINHKNNYEINITWHDLNEGIEIYNKTMSLVSENTLNEIVSDLKSIEKSILYQTQEKINILQDKIDYILTIADDNKDIRLSYLKDNLSIAKKLGIKEPKNLTINNVDLSSQTFIDFEDKFNPYSTTIYPNLNYPYYLMGYEVIQSEIEILKNKTNLEIALQEKKYHEIKNEIFELKSNIFSNLFSSYIDKIEKVNLNSLHIKNKVNLEVKNQKIRLINLIFYSLVITFLFAFGYIFFQNSLRLDK